MNDRKPTSSEIMYIPLFSMLDATFKHSLAKIQVAAMHAPEHICGIAQRVGYTGNQESDLAMYRLKVRSDNERSTVTLPGFFVIHNGVFLDYESWCKSQKK
ncbi:MAG TPA: hypothetical protein VEV19_05085 [Ktedonobacteraceae bacterium]|nr:hypothetical protein [Ktedonobacteraceae bacterium]